MPEANAEMLTQLYPPAEKDETAEKHSILEVYVLTAMENEKDNSTEKDGNAEVDNNSEMNEEEINSESELAEMEDDDDDDITEVDTITTMINSTVMNSEVEANSEPEFEEKDANIENNVDATAKMNCNADTDNTQQTPKVPSYASITIDGTIKINGTTVMKDFVPVEGIPKADETETAETRGLNGPTAMICLSGKSLGKGKKDTKTKGPVATEAQVKAAKMATVMPLSEGEMIKMLPKLQKKYKKAQKEMCPFCKNQGFIKYQTTLKLGAADNKYNMQMFLLDMVNGEEDVPAIPTQYLN